MITLHYYLDCRATQQGQSAPLKLALCKRGDTAMLPTGIRLLPSEWDARHQEVVNTPRRRILNAELSRLRNAVDDYLRPRIYAGELAPLSAKQIRDLVDAFLNGEKVDTTFKDVFDLVCSQHDNSGTRAIYHSCWANVRAYDRYADTRKITSFDESWATAFEKWLLTQGKAKNTRNSIYRCLKSAWHYAQRKGIVQGDPFAGISTSAEQGRKRDLSVEQLRTLWAYQPTDAYQARAKDVFFLSLFLRAANIADIVRIREDDIYNGRLYYKRAKTGKAYSVKVEVEARELLDRVRLREGDNARNLTTRTNRYLAMIAGTLGLPPITTYWARHSWASLAFKIGASMDLVSAGLGHSLGGAKVTATYVDISDIQVDELNRKIIDLVTK